MSSLWRVVAAYKSARVYKEEIIIEARMNNGVPNGFTVKLQPGLVIYGVSCGGNIHGSCIVLNTKGKLLFRGKARDNVAIAEYDGHTEAIAAAQRAANGAFTYIRKSLLKAWLLPHLFYFKNVLNDNGVHVYIKDNTVVEKGVLIIYTNCAESMGFYEYNGGQFSGLFRDGRLHGGMCRADYSRDKTTDVAAYAGTFRNGLYDGSGKLTMKTGEVYEGTFRRGCMHGAFHCTTKSKSEFEMIYAYGKLVDVSFFFDCFMLPDADAARGSPYKRPKLAHNKPALP